MTNNMADFPEKMADAQSEFQGFWPKIFFKTRDINDNENFIVISKENFI